MFVRGGVFPMFSGFSSGFGCSLVIVLCPGVVWVGFLFCLTLLSVRLWVLGVGEQVSFAPPYW